MDPNDVLTWDLDQVPFAVREDMGPMYVWWNEVLLAQFPWHCYSHIDERGNLHILDLIARRWVRNWDRGQWTEVNRQMLPGLLRPASPAAG